jgi:hypothetical protein
MCKTIIILWGNQGDEQYKTCKLKSYNINKPQNNLVGSQAQKMLRNHNKCRPNLATSACGSSSLASLDPTKTSCANQHQHNEFKSNQKMKEKKLHYPSYFCD